MCIDLITDTLQWVTVSHFFFNLRSSIHFTGEQAYAVKIEVFSSIHFHICSGDVLADGLLQQQRVENAWWQILIAAQFAPPWETCSGISISETTSKTGIFAGCTGCDAL